MPIIVNLSALHKYSIAKTLDAFTEVCNRYSTGCMGCCCPSFFQSWTNSAWVAYQYNTKYKELIEPYRLGQIESQQFLQNLEAIFDFINKNNLGEDDDLLGVDDNTTSNLLTKAWNASIVPDATMDARFSSLVTNQTEPLYLVSNSNELNVLAIIELLRANNPTIKFYKEIDLSVTYDPNPVEIAPNIFICLSYRYQLFKTNEQNQSVKANPHSTMSLLQYLVAHNLSYPPEQITLISQYEGDLEQAKNIGIPEDNIYHADNYFSANLKEGLII
jgi:hypothetical protein